MLNQLSVISYQCQPPTINYQPPTINHQPPTINHQLSCIILNLLTL
ncbi:MAG: hypothetical protein VKN72_22115 [Nostocales cyanobacterium 94392]|nr:hypothetical protein [Nostocales cyanobacterium 94392]